jgi:hypothetical protein
MDAAFRAVFFERKLPDPRRRYCASQHKGMLLHVALEMSAHTASGRMAATVMPASPSQRTSNSVDKIDGLLEKLQLKRQQSEPPVAPAAAAPPTKAINWADDDLDESFEVPEAWAKELSSVQPSATPSRPVVQTAQRQTPAPPVTVKELFPSSTPSIPPRTATPRTGYTSRTQESRRERDGCVFKVGERLPGCSTCA